MQRIHARAKHAGFAVTLNVRASNRTELTNRSGPSDPHRSRPIFKQRENILARQLRVHGKFSSVEASEPVGSPDPETAFPRKKQASNIGAREMLSRRRLPWCELDAIKPNNAELSAEPQIAVGPLSHRVNDALEKSVSGRPGCMGILTDGERGVQSPCMGAKQ